MTTCATCGRDLDQPGVWLLCREHFGKDLAAAQRRVAELRLVIDSATAALKCCPEMTVDVPPDSVQAGIPYCPKHGRHQQKQIFKALVELAKAGP